MSYKRRETIPLKPLPDGARDPAPPGDYDAENEYDEWLSTFPNKKPNIDPPTRRLRYVGLDRMMEYAIAKLNGWELDKTQPEPRQFELKKQDGEWDDWVHKVRRWSIPLGERSVRWIS